MNSILKDYIYPALIVLLTVGVSYFSTYKFNQYQDKHAKSLKQIDLIDRLLINLSSLILVLEEIKTDPEKHNFFSFQNINKAYTTLSELKQLLELIIVFEDDSLRASIIDLYEKTMSVVNEINNLEYNPSNKFQQLETIKKQREEEFRRTRLELLSMNVFLDTSDNFSAKSVCDGLPLSDTHMRAVQQIIEGMVADINSNQNELNNINAESMKKRPFLAVDLQGVLQKATDLKTTLQGLKISIQKSK